MGAGYWAALAQAFVILRDPSWDRARTSIPAGLTATTLLLVATILHLSQFHLNSPSLLTRFVTWVWIAVYVVTPPVFLYFFVTQMRKSGDKIKGSMPYSGLVQGSFFLMAAFGLVFGLGLFFLPESFMLLWPWPLKPLASRAVGTWIATFGVAAATLAWDNDRANGTGAAASLLAFCVLQFVVILRYSSSMDFAKLLAWGYILFLLFGLILGGMGLLKNK